MAFYRLIDHTADIGIRVEGRDPRTLFVNAGRALFDLLTAPSTLAGAQRGRLQVTGDDWPDLMANWLRELLYLWTGEEKLVKRITIEHIDEHALTATVAYDRFRPGRHVIKTEIKAVTYHQLQVQRSSSGWAAQVIFDI